jgi:chromosome segregation ATPase
LEDIRTELPWMRRHASEARAPVDTLSKRKIMLEGRIGDSRADFEREVKRLEEFEAEVERLEKRKSLVESAALLPSARDKADRQRGVVEATRRSIRSDREQLATIEAELDQAVEILTDKRSALRSAVTRATDLEKQIPKMRSAATDAQSQRERVGAVIEKRESIVTQGQIETAREREEKARRDQEAADERERQQRLKRDQEAINSGRPLSFNAEPVRRSLDQAEGSFDGLNQAVLDFARHMVADAAQTKNELADLRRGFGKIESRRVDSMS